MPTDGTGLPFDGRGDVGASPFWGSSRTSNPLEQGNMLTPFPIQHLMNNFRFGTTHRGTSRCRCSNWPYVNVRQLLADQGDCQAVGFGSRLRVSSCSTSQTVERYIMPQACMSRMSGRFIHFEGREPIGISKWRCQSRRGSVQDSNNRKR